jgi:hypothetical protein
MALQTACEHALNCTAIAALDYFGTRSAYAESERSAQAASG